MSIRADEEFVFSETDKEKADALLYTALFDEINRLKRSRSKKERQMIRDFILEGYLQLQRSLAR